MKSSCDRQSRCDNKCERGPIGPKGATGATGATGASFLDFGTSCTFFTRDIFPGTGCTGCTGSTGNTGTTIFIHAEVAATPFPSPVLGGNPYSVFKADECPEVNPNIDLVLEPKGSGAIMANEPNGLPSGGNNRGAFATDFQRSRDLAQKVASGVCSTISGGCNNSAKATGSTVSGGRFNNLLATGTETNSTVGGGFNNNSLGVNSTVGGGIFNVARSDASTVSGGSSNSTFAECSTISGGCSNRAIGINSTIGGGLSNTAFGTCSTIPGGCFNIALGDNSFVTGNNAQANHSNSFVYGGAPGPTQTTANNQAIFNLRPAAYSPVPADPNTFFINGNLFITGTASANVKSFVIDHPILENKSLRHFCTEAPRADLMYRGTVQLVNGRANVDIDATSKMTNGTFMALAKNVEAYLTNKLNWDLVRVENHELLSTGKFTIISNNIESNTLVNWLIIAERKFEEEMLIELDKPKMNPEAHNNINNIEIGESGFLEHQRLLSQNERTKFKDSPDDSTIQSLINLRREKIINAIELEKEQFFDDQKY